MTTTESLKRSHDGLASFWLLMPAWLRRFSRDARDPAAETFLRAADSGNSSLSSRERARQVELLTARSLLEAFRTGAVRR